MEAVGINVFPYVQPHQMRTTALEHQLAANIAKVLTEHYPGYPWAVNVSAETGIATVENWALSTKDGYIIKMKSLNGPTEVTKAAIIAGGEFLERHGLPRSKAEMDQMPELTRAAIFK
jgi:hypothetical protein